MILYLFILLFAVNGFFLVLGYIFDLPVLKLIAWTFYFLSAINMMNEGIDVNIGKNITEVIPCNATIEDYCSQYDSYNVTTLERDAYYNYTNHVTSYWLAIMSFVMFVDTLITIRKDRKRDKDREDEYGI